MHENTSTVRSDNENIIITYQSNSYYLLVTYAYDIWLFLGKGSYIRKSHKKMRTYIKPPSKPQILRTQTQIIKPVVEQINNQSPIVLRNFHMQMVLGILHQLFHFLGIVYTPAVIGISFFHPLSRLPPPEPHLQAAERLLQLLPADFSVAIGIEAA